MTVGEVATMEVDAVLFDIDGTLVDSTAAVERVWRAWGAEFGADAEDILAIAHGRRSEDVVARFVPPQHRADAHRRYQAIELTELDEADALPGTAALLVHLPANRWAAVTSGVHQVMTARLAAAGLPVPGVVITADDVSEGKPDPMGYRLAAKLLGVDPARCLVIEDAPAGIEAGNAAGASTIAVTTTHAPARLTHATYVIPDLRSVSVEVAENLRVSVTASR